MLIYSDMLREAREPPSLELDGVTYTGRLISHEEFILHDEALFLARQALSDSYEDTKHFFITLRAFLEAIFPREEILEEPEEVKEMNVLERFWYWVSGRLPTRTNEFLDAHKEWRDNIKRVDAEWAVNVICGRHDAIEIAQRLFTYQRGPSEQEADDPMNTETKQKSPVSSKEPNQSKPKKKLSAETTKQK